MSEILLPLAERRDSRLNFRLILLSVFLEKFGFYGLKTVLLFYAILNLKIPESQFFTYVIYGGLILILARLIGGLVSDFLTGPKIAMIIGLSVCLTGGILTLIENSSIFLTAIIVLFFGSGFYRTSLNSFIGHLSINNPVLLEKRFILNSIVTNVGSMLATLSLGLIGEYFGYFYALLVVCLVYILSLIVVSRVRAVKNDFSLDDSVIDEKIHSKGKIKFVLLAIVGVAYSMFIFQLYDSYQADRPSENGISLFGWTIPDSFLFSIPAIVSFLLIVPYYFLATKLSITFKLALGCFLLAALVLVGIPVFTSGVVTFGLFGLLLVGSLEMLIEFIMTLTMAAFICRYSPKKIYGTLFGIEAVLTYVASVFASIALGIGISTTASILLGVPLIGVAIYFLYLRKKFQPSDNFRLEKRKLFE